MGRSLITMAMLMAFPTQHYAQQWVQTNGPTGGTVPHVIALDSGIFIGTDGAGVLRSTNGGLSWTTASPDMPNAYIRAMTRLGGHLFVSTYDGVFRSTDAGATWEHADSGLAGEDVLVLHGSGTELFAGTGSPPGGIFHSTDEGTSWIRINPGQVIPWIIALQSVDSFLFAGTGGGGVFRTSDGGGTWTEVNTGLTDKWVKSLTVSGSSVFVGTTSGGVFRTTNYGGNWVRVSSGLPPVSTVFALLPKNGTIFAGIYGGVYRSTNNGSSWSPMTGGLTDTEVRSLATDDTLLFAGTGHGGVFRASVNGGSWATVNAGLINTTVMTTASMGTTLLAGLYRLGLFRSTDAGSTWLSVGEPLSNVSIHTLTVRNGFFIAGSDDGVFFSSDSGLSWTAVNSGLPSSGHGFVTSFTATGNTLFAASTSEIYRLEDGDTVWTRSDSGISGMYAVTTLAVSGDILFAGSGGDGVFISTDNGRNWSPSIAGLTDLNIASLAVRGTDVLAGTRFGGVFVSTDSGQNWIEANAGLPPSAWGVSSFAMAGDNLFIVAGGMVYFTAGETIAWLPFGAGLPDGRSITLSGDDLFAGTEYRGVWRRSIVTGVATPPLQLPRSYSLEQNYPNPFNPVTTIRYGLPNTGRVRIEVYTVLGQMVVNLVDGVQPAGFHVTSLDASNLPGGIYFCRIVAGSYTDAIKMLLIK